MGDIETFWAGLAYGVLLVAFLLVLGGVLIIANFTPQEVGCWFLQFDDVPFCTAGDSP